MFRKQSMFRKTGCLLLAASITLGAQSSQGLLVAPAGGDGAFNDIQKKIGRNPIVKVTDEAGAPVEGARVTFELPSSGPSGTFAGGVRTLSTSSDAKGFASATGMTPNAVEGRFEIAVT